jgi:hypothetical protein
MDERGVIAGIKQALFLSESTVEKHVDAIFTKLGHRLRWSIAGSSPYSRSWKKLLPPTGLTARGCLASYFDLK